VCSSVPEKCSASIFTVAEFGLDRIQNDIREGNKSTVYKDFRECDQSELMKGNRRVRRSRQLSFITELFSPSKHFNISACVGCFRDSNNARRAVNFNITETVPSAPTRTKFSHHEDGGGPCCCPQKLCFNICITPASLSPNRDTEFLGTGTHYEINKLTTTPVA
jgi:hypothetical protein